jgi:antitoxin component of RelBE/YafQ-DinJ toxin-antitoxin module
MHKTSEEREGGDRKMTLTVEIPTELEEKLEAEAAELGLTASEYVRGLLERMLGRPAQTPLWMTATKQEWLKAFSAWMDGHDPTLPPLSDDAISREGIYGERG